MRLILRILLMYIKGLLITVSRVFSCVQLSYIDPILLSHSYIFATSRDLNTTGSESGTLYTTLYYRYIEYNSLNKMEDITDNEKLGIAKLTGPNYWPWSVQVQTILVGRDLWDVVESGVYTPRKGDLKPKDTATSGTQDAASEEAQKDDQKNRTVQK